MASTIIELESRVIDIELEATVPKSECLSLVTGMLFLMAVASVWAGLIVGVHFLELHFL